MIRCPPLSPAMRVMTLSPSDTCPTDPAPEAGPVPAALAPLFAGGGDCGRLLVEGAPGPLGPLADWPPLLLSTVGTMMAAPVPKVLMWGPEARLLYNDGYAVICGSRHPAALGAPAREVWPEVWDWNSAVLAACGAGRSLSYLDQKLVLTRAGAPEEAFFNCHYWPVRDAQGVVQGVMCTLMETTARVLAERRVAAQAAEMVSLTDALPALVAVLDPGLVVRFANRMHGEWMGMGAEALVGRHMREILDETHLALCRPHFEAALAGQATLFEMTLPVPGRERRVEVHCLPRLDAAGRTDGALVVTFDIEDRARRAEELRRSNARFRRAMDAVHGVLWTNDADGRMRGEQPGWAALTGQTPEEYEGHGWVQAVHPEDVGATLAAWEAALAGRTMFVHEHRVRRHDGRWRRFAVRALPVTGPAGEVTEWVGVHTDITHRRAAEAALREQAEDLAREVRQREAAEVQLRQINETLEARVAAEITERRKAEARLLHSQKMEAIGKLTGGVAHDFNNLLQVVSGNLQLIQRDVAGHPRAEARVANAMAGVTRGARLAAQLLAFGRRQALDPRVVNIARLLQGMEDLLHRALGEAVEVELVTAAGLWTTFIDPSQLENAVLNLAINARDAMEGSGRLTIELANMHLDAGYVDALEDVAPGQYVMLAVSDTGRGMGPEVLERVFEPFFTTKPEGKGSGLGLPMVYGFVKQSGGHVRIYSEPGHGTTIRLYLPRAMQAEDVEVRPLAAGPVTGGSETVLVVEDDAEVRAVVVEMLADLGYRVLRAGDAQAALSVIESGIPIDLLFTDVVMPGPLKSPELARQARQRLPGIAVLFTSGYTENSIIHGGRLDPGVELISKPYTREALARRLRQLLDGRAGRKAGPGGAPAGEGAADPGRGGPGTEDHGSAGTGARGTSHHGTAGQDAEGRGGPPEGPLRILVVEDDALIRLGLQDMLEDLGHRSLAAGGGEEALQILAQQPVDLLVTDVNLPGLRGPDLAARARETRPGLPVVFATGDDGGLQTGPGVAVVLKPFDEQALKAALARALAPA